MSANTEMNMNTETNADVIALQETEDMPIAPAPVESGWLGMLPMVLIFVLFYFLLIRPQEKKRREHEEFVSGVKKGEEVMTNSGLFGRVTKVNDSDNTIMVQIAKDVEVKMQKNSISDIVSRAQDKAKDTKQQK